jgi:glycosyltransferase involved in cell wall biosynthesis
MIKVGLENTPLVSVVMGVHNGASQIQTTLSSVFQQHGVDFEVIVVNDGSTDATAQVLEKIATEARSLKIIHQPKNLGLTKALIAGCNAARGTFIARQDLGDISLPGRLVKQCEFFESNSELAMVSCWTRTTGPQNEPLYETRRTAEPRQATHELQHCFAGPPHHGSVMFRREAYLKCHGYREQFYFSQDTDLWLRLTEIGLVGYVQATLYEFQISRKGISSQFREAQHELGLLAHKCAEARRRGKSEEQLLLEAQTYRPSVSRCVKPDLVAGDYFIGKCLARNGDLRGIEYLRRVVTSRPTKLGAWLGLSSLFLRNLFNLGLKVNHASDRTGE